MNDLTDRPTYRRDVATVRHRFGARLTVEIVVKQNEGSALMQH